MRLFKYMFFISLMVMLTCSANAHVDEYHYIVTGTNDFGSQVAGDAHSREGDVDIVGRVVDEDGNVQFFRGQWDGYQQISGETPDGTQLQLDTY